MTPDFRLSKGDRPRIQDTLTNDDGVVNLTGCTVKFNFQGAGVSYSKDATISDAATGKVEYTLAVGESDMPGVYQAQWVMTKDGVTTTFPTGSLENDDENGRYLVFEIVDTVPIVPPANITLISETFEGVRAIMGDLDPVARRFEDTSIASVVRTCLRSGKVQGYSVTPDNRGISPAISDPRIFGVLIYNAAKMILLPNVSDYSYRTRALSERFGDQKYFLFELQNQLFDLENADGGTFRSFQSFYGWVNALTGANIWSMMTDMKTNAPVASVVIGRAGITVNTT